MYKTAMTIKLNTITTSVLLPKKEDGREVYGGLTYEKTIKESTETSSPMTRVTDDFEVGYSGLVRHVHVNKNYEALPNGKWWDGVSGVVRDVNETEPRLGFEKKGVLKAKKKTETKPVPFSKVALASIKEALDAGGFKNWADFQSLKGVGPVTSKIMEDLGWADHVYFFYEEDPLSSGITRVSPYYTLDQIKKKHPNGTGFQKRNFSFCAGAMTTLDHHPGLRKYSVPKKRKKVEEREPVLADLTNPCAGELLDPRNRIVVTSRRRVERLVGWKARNPHVKPGQGVKTKHGTFHQGSCCLLVPEGYNEVLAKLLIRSTLNCRLADVLGMPGRPEDKEETCESVGWVIAPKRLQDHKVKVRKEASRLIDVDRDVENIINAAELDDRTAAMAAAELKLKQENKQRVKEGKKPKKSPDEWRAYLEECFLEVNSGAGKVARDLKRKASEYQRLLLAWDKAVAENTEPPCTREEYVEVKTKKYFKVAHEYRKAMSIPELGNMIWVYETFIEGQFKEEVLRDKLQAGLSGNFFSADLKSFETLDEEARRSDPNFMEVLWGRDDYGWESAQIEEMEANRREVMSRERALIPLDQKLSYTEANYKLVAIKKILRHGQKEMEATIRGRMHGQILVPTTKAKRLTFRCFEVIDGKKEEVWEYHTYSRPDYSGRQFHHSEWGYSPEKVIWTPEKRVIIPAIPAAESEEEFDARLAEYLRTRS